MISETFREFFFCHYLSPQELGQLLTPPVDEEIVKRWEAGEEALPVGVKAQLYQMSLRLEKYKSDLWKTFNDDPHSQHCYISYNNPKEFQELQPDKWQFFGNKLAIYIGFLAQQGNHLHEIGLKGRITHVAMYYPEYKAWLTKTNQQHSKEVLWRWAGEEYAKYGSRLHHPKWEKGEEAFKRRRAEETKARASAKSQKEPSNHNKIIEDSEACGQKGRDNYKKVTEDQIERRPDGTIYLKKCVQRFRYRYIENETLRSAQERLRHLRNEKNNKTSQKVFSHDFMVTDATFASTTKDTVMENACHFDGVLTPKKSLFESLKTQLAVFGWRSVFR